jgi:hypothetical protein
MTDLDGKLKQIWHKKSAATAEFQRTNAFA